jgi:pantetheine-phosphate adenylyltransferase
MNDIFHDYNDLTITLFLQVALGGTFDQMHNGHRKLLTLAAASCTEVLIIGVTNDEMLKNKKNSEQIALFSDRKQSILDLLSIVKPQLELNIIELTDPYGPTITSSSIDALVVSSETMATGYKINQIRLENGLNPLTILVSRRSGGATMSSTFIRESTIQSELKDSSNF